MNPTPTPQQSQTNINPQTTALDANTPITYTDPQGQQITAPYGQLPALVQNLVNQQWQQRATLQETSASGARTTATIPTAQRQSQQAQAPNQLATDLKKNKITLPSAINKYQSQGMSADDIFKQYLAQSPWGLPKESITQLKNMGITDDALGKIGDTGSFMDRNNTRAAINEIDRLQSLWKQTNALSSIASKVNVGGILGAAGNSAAVYDAAKTQFGEHYQSLIPGAPSASADVAKIMGTLPDSSNLTDYSPERATELFNNAKEMLLKQKNYQPNDLGLTQNDVNPTNGGQMIRNIIKTGSMTGNTSSGTPLTPGGPNRPGAGGGYKDLAALLPTIFGTGGAIAGAAVPIGGETGATEIAGGAIGQGVGQAIENAINGKPIMQNVAEQTTGGLVTGGVFRGAGLLAGKAFTAAGENEATQALNLTNGIKNSLRIKNGQEPVAQTLAKNNIVGGDVDAVKGAIEKAQTAFDSIAKNSKIPVDMETFRDTAQNAIDELRGSSVPSNQKLASSVEQGLSNIWDKIQNGSITSIADLNKERQAFDNATNDSQFGGATWGTNRIIGDALRSTVYHMAQDAGDAGVAKGKSLQEQGLNLRNLHNIANAADKRVGQGNSASILSVSNSLLGLVGSTIGGFSAGPLGAILGYGTPIAARAALRNPIVAKILSTGAIGAGKAAGNPVASTVGAVGANQLMQYLRQQP